jgi:two-component system, OmpR family, osmolarity sensor histidine kinase EnvZ
LRRRKPLRPRKLFRGTLRSIKRLFPRTLLGRAILIIGAPLFLVQVIATAVFYERHYDNITKRLAQAIAGEVAIIIQLLGDTPGTALSGGQLDLAETVLQFDIAFQKGALLPDPPPPSDDSVLDRKLDDALAQRLIYPFEIDTVSSEQLVWVWVQLPDGVMSVRLPRSRLFSDTTYFFIAWMVGSSIVLFAVATFFMRNQVRPIRRLAKAAESFGRGIDVPDFKPQGAAEVRLAARAFLQMRERIRRQIDQRTIMLAGVSHDLRTPLTRMKLQLAMADADPEVTNLASDVIEMERMVEGYLAFAAGEGEEEPKTLVLSSFLASIVEQVSKNGARIDLRLDDDPEITLRPAAMRRCLTNLLSNALRYGSEVHVRAKVRQKRAEIIIDDNGPGIPAERREDVFRPFYRLDESRNPSTGGTGLGMTIARDVVRGHGGELTLEDSPTGGLRARIRLPL